MELERMLVVDIEPTASEIHTEQATMPAKDGVAMRSEILTVPAEMQEVELGLIALVTRSGQATFLADVAELMLLATFTATDALSSAAQKHVIDVWLPRSQVF